MMNPRCMMMFAWACFAWLGYCRGEEADLVARWSFEENTPGKAMDGTGRGHDLTLSGVRRVPGAIGKGLLFAGGKSKVETKNIDDLQSPTAVTVAAWIRPDAPTRQAEGIGIVYAGNILLRITHGTPSFHVFTQQWAPIVAKGMVRPHQWYYVEGTYDGTEMRIYVNGDLAGVRRRSGAIPASTRPLQLGQQVNAFVGVMDEVSLRFRCLSAAEIAADFAAAVSRLNPGVSPGTLTLPYEEIFGDERTQVAPRPTRDHLPPADLCFAVFTDTHIGSRGEEHHYCHPQRVVEVLRNINALAPDLAVHCGDIITSFPKDDVYPAQCEYALSLLGQCRVPCHLVPGNHDIGNQDGMKIWGEAWAKRTGKSPATMLFNEPYRQTYEKYFGKDFTSFTQGDCRFIIFDNAICNSNTPLEREQEAWLERELRRGTANRMTFVFAHNPLFWNRLDEPGPMNYEPIMLPARKRLLKLFTTFGVKAVYTGHTHFGFANTYGGVWLRTINSTTFNRIFPTVAPGLAPEAHIYDPFQVGFLLVRVVGDKLYESWINTYWRVGAPPAALADMCRGRLIGRPAVEVRSSRLGLPAAIPRPFVQSKGGREGINDQYWRLAEEVGAGRTDIWPPPATPEGWQALERALTLGLPKGVKLSFPLSMQDESGKQAWQRVAKHRDVLDAVVVCAGAPTDPAKPLTSWRNTVAEETWPAACEAFRARVGPGLKLVLARLPLTGPDAAETLARVCASLTGKVDAVRVWTNTEEPPEKALEPALRQAAALAASRNLDLWLDADCWHRASPRLRAAYALRLLAICQAYGIRLTWWGRGAEAGLLDENLDPTPLFYALQAWYAMVDGSSEKPTLQRGKIWTLRWRDVRGRNCLAWWRPDAELERVGTLDSAVRLPEEALFGDPLDARLLRPPANALPLCAWPVLARSAGR